MIAALDKIHRGSLQSIKHHDEEISFCYVTICVQGNDVFVITNEHNYCRMLPDSVNAYTIWNPLFHWATRLGRSWR